MLAAGASSRLGSPKQLLRYKGITLLEHAAKTAVDTGTKSIVAVLGANAGLLIKEIVYLDVQVAVNREWQEGMASSIRCGLKKLLDIVPGMEAIIIMVCDQPFVTSKLLAEMVAKYRETGKPIIASSYKSNIGTPALFDKSIFASLLELKGDSGAKGIMKDNPGWVEIVNFPAGNIDIDTELDYEALLRITD